MNPFLATDSYKVGHHKMYPEGTTLVYSNFTPRSNNHAQYVKNINGEVVQHVVSIGQQMVMREIEDMFSENFFMKSAISRDLNNTLLNKNEDELKEHYKSLVCGEIQREYSMHLGTEYDVSHIEALWDLGYLPIVVKALPEGSLVPIEVPVLTIYNTKPEFFWLTNFLETLISNLLWKPMTSATIAHQYKQNLLHWAKETDKDNLAFVDFQGHNFSMRGMDSMYAVMSSGIGHASSFKGDDSLPVIHAARKYYDEKGFVVSSVNATEHSVMSAGGDKNELDTFRYLMKQFPTGILSIVSDTWNLWDVLTKHLPELKEEILARDGKIVVRPDSGDPVDIICGTTQYHNNTTAGNAIGKRGSSIYEAKGVIELLWDLFGGTINEQGYKVLDPHIGAIYGDAITLDRANEICERLQAKGFASTNIVLGIGSFTYQFNTRDTFGFAMKATYVELQELHNPTRDNVDAEIKVIGREIFKDPITDDGTKKSAKGLLNVQSPDVTKSGEYELLDQQDWKSENGGELQTIFKDGEFFNQTTLSEIRERL